MYQVLQSLKNRDIHFTINLFKKKFKRSKGQIMREPRSDEFEIAYELCTILFLQIQKKYARIKMLLYLIIALINKIKAFTRFKYR